MTKKAKKMYQREYGSQAHWDIRRPSSKIANFISYLKGGERILDAGCGTGRDTIFLAKKGFKVIGVDFIPIAIQKAKRKRRGLENAKFDVGDIETLPYKDGFFDAVYSVNTLQHTNMRKSFKELARVLKPGGIAFFTMFLETKYNTPSKRKKAKVIDKKNVLDVAEKNFIEILDEEIEEYYDYENKERKEGKHKHKRLMLVLRK